MTTKHTRLLLLPLLFGVAHASAQTETSTLATDSIEGAMYEMLDELVVTSDRPVVKSDGATTTYSVDDDPSAKGTTVLDVLRKVPMVTVDGQDNIRLKGDGGFKIYVNGREDASLTANASTVLKAMPAEAVAQIEVITEPGAKYDAEGSAGIINLVTVRRQKLDGYSGNASFSMSNRNLMPNAYLLGKTGNVTASLNASYAKNIFAPQKSWNHSETENSASDSDHLLIDHLMQKVNFHFTDVSANLAWEPDPSNLLSVSAHFSDMGGTVDGANEIVNMYDRSGNRTWGYTRSLDGTLGNRSVNANASFQHSFNERGHNIILSYQFNYGRSPFELDYRYCDPFNYSFTADRERSLNLTFSREHTAQLDYSNPVAEGQLIEVGLKGIWRPNSSFGDLWAKNDGVTESLSSATRLRQDVDIYAAYASWSGSFGLLSAKAGVRYEYTDMSIYDRIEADRSFSTHLNDVVPNAALAYNFSPMSALRLAYQMRISRPTIDQVNPFEQMYGANIIRMGNPDLDSERSNNISLTYSSFGPVLGGTIGLEETLRDNTITSWVYYKGNTQYSTYANLGCRSRTALTGFLTWSITRGMRLAVNGSVDYQHMSAPSEHLSNHGWGGNWSGNWSYSLPADWDLGAYGGQSLHMIDLQGHSDGWYYYGASVTKSLLADKSLRVTLQASNFLQSTISYKSVTRSGQTEYRNTWTNRSWNVGLTLSWKFGKLQTQVRKTGANIDNNDAATDSAKKGGVGSM